MDSARVPIEATLIQLKTFLAQESPDFLSEADTKAHFVEPILRALGWEGLGVVTREYYVRNSQEFIDYALRGPDGLVMAIETKKLQVDLADKHAAQLVQYCAVEGIEWAVLTNGRELQLFNTFLKRDLAAKRVMHLDLLAFNSSEEFEGIFDQLWHLSYERMTAPSEVRTWMHQQRLDATLRQILVNPGSSVITHLQTVLADAEVNATPQDVVHWFRSILTTSAAVQWPRTVQPIQPPKPDPPISPIAPHQGRLQPLIAEGLLQPNSRLVIVRRGNVELQAHVDEHGYIVYNGAPYRSPSDRVFASALGRQSLNGWRNWQVDLPTGRTTLDALRERLLQPEPVESD